MIRKVRITCGSKKKKSAFATQVINENYELKTTVTSYVYVK